MTNTATANAPQTAARPDMVERVRAHARTYLTILAIVMLVGGILGAVVIFEAFRPIGIVTIAAGLASAMAAAFVWKMLWMKILTPKCSTCGTRLSTYFCSVRHFVYHCKSCDYDICSTDMKNCRKEAEA